MRSLRLPSMLGLVALLPIAGCGDWLEVTNPNDPDRERVLSTPGDVETVIQDSWNVLHAGLHNANDALYPQMLVLALESHSEVANFGMGVRGGIPRTTINNSRGNPVQIGNYRDFVFLHRAARLAALGLSAFELPNFTLGSAAADTAAIAFARFVLGVAHGYLAAVYDSAAIVLETDDLQLINPLHGYRAVHAAALSQLEAAIELAEAGSAFSYTPGWFATPEPVSRDRFVRITRSFRARIRAMVARTPEEREEVPWSDVIADAEHGITADLIVQMRPPVQGGSWDMLWFGPHFASTALHVMWQFMVGMADVSGAYDAWLQAPRAAKERFLVITPDRRFPPGADRATQQANSPLVPPPGQYFRNLPAVQDVATERLARSMYQHARFRAFRDAIRTGPFPYLQVTELTLLRAEGHLRRGELAEAAALIDITRVGIGGLPPLTGAIASLDDPVPGDGECVPRVPGRERTADYVWSGSSCGTIMEALKWEKRLELALTTWGAWYFDARGWGDLPEGTPLHWMVPWQEADTRRMPIYHGGEPSRGDAAGRGTYDL